MMLSTPRREMPKSPKRGKSVLAVTKEGAKVKAASAQLFADVVYWATVVASIERTTVAKLADPMLRTFFRERLQQRGLDPDRMWEEAQAEKEKGAK